MTGRKVSRSAKKVGKKATKKGPWSKATAERRPSPQEEEAARMTTERDRPPERLPESEPRSTPRPAPEIHTRDEPRRPPPDTPPPAKPKVN